MILNSVTKDKTAAPAAAATAGADSTAVASVTPKVTDAPANPFSVQATANIPQANSGTPTQIYQNGLVLAQRAAVAFATYNSSQNPDSYVATIPGLTADAKQQLVASAKSGWEQVQKTQANAQASQATGVPEPVSYNVVVNGEGFYQGTAEIAVTITQTIKSTTVNQTRNTPVLVWLTLTPPTPATATDNQLGTWNVTGLSR